MGSPTTGFPPTTPPLLGITDTLTGQTGSIVSTPLFTAKYAGLYEFAIQVHLVSTNNAGTLSCVFAVPSIGTVATLAPSVSTGKDAVSTTITAWMNLGDALTIVATATGLTGTTYNVFVNAQQLL
jgi:hypothetical protein